MILIKAEKELKKWKKIQDQINQPYNLQDLNDRLKSLEDAGLLISKEDLSDKDSLELKAMLEFLETPRKRKIYETFIHSRDFDRPKTLFISPLWGFQGQIEKLAENFPELFQQIKDGYFELTDILNC